MTEIAIQMMGVPFWSAVSAGNPAVTWPKMSYFRATLLLSPRLMKNWLPILAGFGPVHRDSAEQVVADHTVGRDAVPGASGAGGGGVARERNRCRHCRRLVRWSRGTPGRT